MSWDAAARPDHGGGDPAATAVALQSTALRTRSPSLSWRDSGGGLARERGSDGVLARGLDGGGGVLVHGLDGGSGGVLVHGPGGGGGGGLVRGRGGGGGGVLARGLDA
ncbi:uncharacterized protein [Miscanthus floridulus]|uniref:uncharacterized protein n=1 Tax=Miscanthus floridulus TaxID=154761 RepID=UPI003458B592